MVEIVEIQGSDEKTFIMLQGIQMVWPDEQKNGQGDETYYLNWKFESEPIIFCKRYLTKTQRDAMFDRLTKRVLRMYPEMLWKESK
jgi:hypothetical protein